MKLSVLTSSNLPTDLRSIKQMAGIPLIRFEDADIDLDVFERGHIFETNSFLLNAIAKHYTLVCCQQSSIVVVFFVNSQFCVIIVYMYCLYVYGI